jgi:pimeloyl-ACP methyl ester carboxylesterase
LRKLGRIAAIAVAVLAVSYPLIGGVIVSTQLASILRVGAPTAQGDGWPAPQRPEDIGYVGDPGAAFGYAFSDVSLPTEIGDMPAWLVTPAAASPSRWAIFVHGIGGRRENGYRFLPVLYEAGLPTLLFSYRNDEGAPPDPSGYYGFGLTEWRDLDAAVRYALANGARDVVLVGESMGGGIVGQFLRHSDRANAVAGIVLDAPALDFTGIVGSTVGGMGLPLAPLLARIGVPLSGLTLPLNLAEANVRAELDGSAPPLFLSHGHADRIVPVAGSDAVVDTRPHLTTYLRTSADHIQSWHEAPERYDGLLAAFLKTIP